MQCLLGNAERGSGDVGDVPVVERKRVAAKGGAKEDANAGQPQDHPRRHRPPLPPTLPPRRLHKRSRRSVGGGGRRRREADSVAYRNLCNFFVALSMSFCFSIVREEGRGTLSFRRRRAFLQRSSAFPRRNGSFPFDLRLFWILQLYLKKNM